MLGSHESDDKDMYGVSDTETGGRKKIQGLSNSSSKEAIKGEDHARKMTQTMVEMTTSGPSKIITADSPDLQQPSGPPSGHQGLSKRKAENDNNPRTVKAQRSDGPPGTELSSNLPGLAGKSSSATGADASSADLSTNGHCTAI